jgi:uncharacterized protein YuzE
MKVSYDPEADAAYVYVRDAEARLGTVTSVPVQDAPGMIVLDFDTTAVSSGSKFWRRHVLPEELLSPAE